MDNLFWERFYIMCSKRHTKPNPVATEIGVSSGVVTKWKHQGTIPNGETLAKIADYLDCSVDYLLGREQYLSKDAALDRLNDLGKQKATEYINDLLENPKYTSKPQPQKGVVIVGDAFEDDVVRSAAYGGGVDDGDDEVHSTDDI